MCLQSQEPAISTFVVSVRWDVVSMNTASESWFKLWCYHELTIVIQFYLDSQTQLYSLWPLSSMLQHVSSKIFNHTTTSRQPFSNFTGFQFIPEFTSRSASLCITYIRGLLHSICLLWLLLALPSCLGKVWGLPPKETSFAPAHACTLEIGRSRSMVQGLGTAFLNRFVAQQQSANSRRNSKHTFSRWTMTSRWLPLSTRLRERLVFYFVRALNAICIVL